MNEKTKQALLVYHRVDNDGRISHILCYNHLVRLGYTVTSFGYDYGDNLEELKTLINNRSLTDFDEIYAVDIAPDWLLGDSDLFDKLVWIDHHATTVAKFHSGIRGIRRVGTAACRLCWRWSHINTEQEPYFLKLVGEADVGDFSDPASKPLSVALSGYDDTKLTAFVNLQLTSDNFSASKILISAANEGQAVIEHQRHRVDDYLKHSLSYFAISGVRFYFVNTGAFEVGPILDGLIRIYPDLEDKAQALFAWRYDGKTVHVSLRAMPFASADLLDLSPIAVKFGGGGHAKACGFTLSLDRLCEEFSWLAVKITV